jgi:phosphoenolpyruvate carboxylase
MNPNLTDDALKLADVEESLAFFQALLNETLLEAGIKDPDALWNGNYTTESTENLAKAYSLFFQLLNLIEEYAVIRHRRELEESEGLSRVSGLWGSVLTELKKAGFNPLQISAQLRQVRVEPVLTAHPTESKRATVLEQLATVFELIRRKDHPDTTRYELVHLRDAMKTALHRLWLTGEVFLQKPTVQDELRNVTHYFTRVFPEAVTLADRRLIQAWKESGLPEHVLRDWKNRPVVQLGDWVGGDRDGHPFVTAEVTKNTLLTLRSGALQLIRTELNALAKRTSISEEREEAPAWFAELLKARAAQLPDRGAVALSRNQREPWRQFINVMIARLPSDERAAEPWQFASHTALLDDLQHLAESLRAVGAARLADDDVIPVIRKVQLCGFHLAALDIRQNSAFHDRAVSQLMQMAGVPGGETFASWSEEQRLGFLSGELLSRRPFSVEAPPQGTEAGEAVGVFRVLAHHIKMFGTGGVGGIIISMTRSVSDLLAVFVLAREAGLLVWTPDGWASPVQIVPLFETIDDLQHSGDIMEGYLSQPIVKRSIEMQRQRLELAKGVQQAMVGYSDSNKDGGIFASLWSLRRAEETLSALGTKHGVRIRFFHGRGGSVNRGAGPTHRFIQALPAEALQGDFRQTEQGEMIAAKYGNIDTAVYNLEIQLACTTLASMKTDRTPEGAEDLIDQLSKTAQEKYHSLIHDEGFIPFFSTATPIDVIERAGIGSRPARRTGKRTIADLRAIPWAFSWSQSRFYMPAWYGVGTALTKLNQEKPEGWTLLKDNLILLPALRYILTNVGSALTLAELDVMKAYAELVPDKTIGRRLMSSMEAEFLLTREMLEKIYGKPASERRPRMQRMMQWRNGKLNQLHQLQIRQLKDWRNLQAEGREAEAEALLPELLQVVHAIAGGLRATG